MMSKVSKEANKPVQALLNAVASSKLRLVRLLIEGGVHVDSRNDRGQTPLMITCSSLNNTFHIRGETRERVVKYLISAGADVNAYDVTGRTPLIYAVITRASVIFDLIDAGADPWWEDCSRKCAFDYALQNGDILQVKIIVDACKRKKMRGIVRDVGDTRGVMRDVTDTRESQEHIQDALRGKQEKKSSVRGSKNKRTSSKKPKVYPKNRKRIIDSRNISTPSLTTFNKSCTNISSENPKRGSLPQVTPAKSTSDKNGNDSKSPPLTSHHTCHPQESTSNNASKSPNIPEIHENSQLCDLCKTVFSKQSRNEAKISNPTSAENLTEYDFSGFLYRRRSTGSLFGLTEKRYETIRKKRELGITMEDLFSSTEINQPGKQPLYVKSSRTNTLVDISTNELLVPNRGRSASVSLPPLNDTRLHVGEVFCSCDGSPFITSAKSVPQLHTMAWSRAASYVITPQSSVYLSSDDECDDLIIIPASRSMTSSPILDMTSSPIRSTTSSPIQSMTSSPDYDCRSQRDMTSPHRERRSPSASCDSESELCLIPTIVLTDCVNTEQM
jgi:hypothetical protein